jgi:fucose permease
MINGMYGAPVQFKPEEYSSFYVVLFSILLLCAGATILQVVGNPIMRDVSPEGTFAKNLSLAQSVKAIGSSFGFLLPPLAGMMFGLTWTILFPAFLVLLAITLALTAPLKIVEHQDATKKPASLGSCLSLLKNKYVLMMVASIFVYVGAEVSMSSGVPILLKENFGILGFGLWVSWAIFFLPILIGRFGGSIILSWLSPKKFLIITTLVAGIGVLAIFSSNVILTYVGIILVGLGFANIFPLVFSITIEHMPQRSNELSGLMVMAISGGAIIPLIMGKVADGGGVLISFVVPLVCLLYILLASLAASRETATVA